MFTAVSLAPHPLLGAGDCHKYCHPSPERSANVASDQHIWTWDTTFFNWGIHHLSWRLLSDTASVIQLPKKPFRKTANSFQLGLQLTSCSVSVCSLATPVFINTTKKPSWLLPQPFLWSSIVTLWSHTLALWRPELLRGFLHMICCCIKHWSLYSEFVLRSVNWICASGRKGMHTIIPNSGSACCLIMRGGIISSQVEQMI